MRRCSRLAGPRRRASCAFAVAPDTPAKHSALSSSFILYSHTEQLQHTDGFLGEPSTRVRRPVPTGHAADGTARTRILGSG